MNCKRIHALDNLFYTKIVIMQRFTWNIEVNIRLEIIFKDFKLSVVW